MSAKNKGSRSELIHCPSCGEDYASTYRRCPFCDAKPPKRGKEEVYEEPLPEEEEVYEEVPQDQEDEEYDYDFGPPLHGGRRLSTNTRGGGYGRSRGPWRVLAWVVAILAVVLIIWAVVVFLLPKLTSCGPGKAPAVSPSPSPSAPVTSSTPAPTPTPVADDPTDAPTGEPTEDPDVTDRPADPTPTPAATAKLSTTDFTISKAYPDPITIRVTGGTAVSWSSSDESVATVSQSGTVTGHKKGTATITCTLDDGSTLTCIARVAQDLTGGGSAATEAPTTAPSTEPTTAPSTEPDQNGASLSTTDFTLSKANGQSATIRVRNGTAASWSSSDTAVATVNQSGTVTGHAPGTATITCTLDDGSTLTCIVRVKDNFDLD